MQSINFLFPHKKLQKLLLKTLNRNIHQIVNKLHMQNSQTQGYPKITVLQTLITVCTTFLQGYKLENLCEPFNFV